MRWPKCGIRLESTGIRLEFGGSIHSTCLHASIIKVKNPQRPLVNILSIFGGENSLRKKGVGGKRENLEEGEIARQRTGWTDVWHARIRVRHLFTLPYSPFPPTSAVYPPPLLCPLLIISSLFTTPFFLREFSPSRIDILLTSGQLVEFQSSGHWNWWNSSRVGTGIGGIPVEWALESYRPMDRPMGRPDGQAYGCGSLWAGSTRQRGAHEYGTVTRRHHASPSPRVVVEFSRREGGPCGPGLSRPHGNLHAHPH